MKINQLKLGSILSYVQMALNVLINLIYTPIMIRFLGQGEYGLYQTVVSTISMLSILSLGFNAGYIRYYAKYKSENNWEAIHKLNGLFLVIFSVIGAVGCVCCLYLTFHLDLIFASGLTSEEYAIARVLMFLQTVNLTVTFPMSVFQSIITVHEKFVVLKLLGMLKTVGIPLISLPLLLAGFRSIALVAVTVGISLFTDILYLYYVLHVLKEKFAFRHFESGVFKDLFIFTCFIAINLIVDQINLNIDKVLLGRFRGTTATAIYSIGFTIYQMYQMFSSSISSVFTPRIHCIVNRTKNDPALMEKQLTEIFIRVGRIQYLVLGLVATGIIFFGKTFIVRYWVGSGYEESYYVALLLVLPASIALIQNLGIEIQRAQNKHRFRAIAYLIMAVVNLVLSIFLCQWYGPIGSAVGTAISLILANGLLINIYYHKKCHVNILAFWKTTLRMSVGLILPVGCGILINIYCDMSRIVLFLLEIVLYTVVYVVSMWLFSMNRYEKDLVLKPVKGLLAKVKT